MYRNFVKASFIWFLKILILSGCSGGFSPKKDAVATSSLASTASSGSLTGASCNFAGQVIASGDTVQGFQSSTVPFGSQCASQKITCTNGVLSPLTGVPACTVQAAASCNFNGQVIASGDKVPAFQAGSVPAGSTCVSQVRTCINGSLSGSYAFASCNVGAPATCSFNGMILQNGGTAPGFASATVPFGQTCSAQTVTCNNGMLSPATAVATCTVSPAAACTFAGKTIQSGDNVQGYPSATVSAGQTCNLETVKCLNGALSPANDVATCTVESAATCNDVIAPQQVRTLSRVQYDNSVNAVLGINSKQAQSTFPIENRANGYTNAAQSEVVTSDLINRMMTAAEAIAEQSVGTELAYIKNSLKCSLQASPSISSQDPCALKYIADRGQSFFRRPLTSGELTDLYSIYFTGVTNPSSGAVATTSGIQTLIATFLQMPQFYYRTELGSPSDSTSNPVQLTQFEIASAISYTLTGGPPDAALMAAAAAGTLNSPSSITAQYQRLVATSAGNAQLADFVMEWLGEDQITSYATAAGPITPTIAAEMKTEAQDFIQQALFSGTGTLNELLTGNYTFVNSDLASYYGLPTSGTTMNFAKMTLAPETGRAGLLSQGAFLVSSSATSGVPLLHRGHFIRSNLLCESLPTFASVGLPGFTPPPFVTPSVGTSTRQALTAEITGVCFNCHQHFMPIGFALENFDPFARYQTTQNGGPVDSSGVVTEPTNVDPASGLIKDPTSFTSTSFANYSGLAATLASDPRTGSCFAYQVTQYISGRAGVAQNECAVRATQQPPTGSSVVTVQQQFSNFLQSKYFTWRSR